jgi:site-specific DNA-cytosine methylase
MMVLSLFDGMSCGKLALDRAGIPLSGYLASEVDKHAMTVSRANHPSISQIGDVTAIKSSDLPKIDLLIGGSPCQGFSYAGKGLNFEDPRSRLFFEYVRLFKETNPTYFLLENVVMIQKWQDVISELLGVEPVFINSKVFSAQDRKRLYWTNIPIAPLPTDKGKVFSDIAEVPGVTGSMRGRRVNPITGARNDYDKSIKPMQYIECRQDDLLNCISTVGKDNVIAEYYVKRQLAKATPHRYMTRLELERAQTLPDDYTASVSYSQAQKMIGNGWTVDVIAHIFKGLTL